MLVLLQWIVAAVAAAVLILRARNAPRAVARGEPRRLSVVFLHPDLGIGGAERLVVDAAVGLQACAHESAGASRSGGSGGFTVTIVTNHHDPTRCFRETADGTLEVRVVANWIPRHIANRGHVLFATLRMAAAAFWVCLAGPPCDAYVVDQVAAAMPVLRVLTRRPVLFYCHHPDQLCDPSRIGKSAAELRERPLMRRAYRAAFDTLEGATMRAATKVVYNSAFTKRATFATFPFLAGTLHGDTSDDILYPPVDAERITRAPPDATLASASPKLRSLIEGGVPFMVSINRYERKKDINLAICALAMLVRRGEPAAARLSLVVAGGYDERLPENVEHFAELQQLAHDAHVDDRVIFLRSFSDAEKFLMLRHALCVLYTPANEHFGIVPIEAMLFGRPVVAVASGGPLESIGLSGDYGLLCQPRTEDFADAAQRLVGDPDQRARIGAAAAVRAADTFGLDAFVTGLAGHLRRLVR